MPMESSSPPEAQEESTLFCSSIPRGGPIFVPNLVGPLTRVPYFESSLLHLLQDLEAEISSGSVNSCDEDISVDELKVFSEVELVDTAMKKAFNDEEELSLIENSASMEDAANAAAAECTNEPTTKATSNTATGGKSKKRRRRTKKSKAQADGGADDSSTRPPENESNAGGEQGKGISNGEYSLIEIPTSKEDTSTTPQCYNESASETTLNTAVGDKAKKRRRKTNNTQALVVSYITKVEEVVQIKKKQDEDKAGAIGLHSFNAIQKISGGAMPSAERAKKLEVMRSTGSKLKPSSIQDHVPLQYPEVVLSVEVYHNNRKFNKTQEFLVLGRQLLTELRDKIYCITDHVMEKACSYDPSGYFLIEDIFCNDLRDPSAVDYSEPILEWLRTSKEEALQKWDCIVSGELQQKQKAVIGEVSNLQLPQFKAVEMQKARFCDLKFQLGAGYLYCHQGDCKHTIVIRDMRLIHPDDVQNRAAYPITTFQHKTRALKCSVCRIYRATRVTLDDKWAQENPCYFCENCYFLLHYSKDRSLMYSDFSVFDYHPD
ncbi:snRNA-activating protein complex subunit isoform X2 [Punica granatum]|uniref:snRNA-activating protein complex subunit isoform X2 n=1 Tax=Punica granatum TaxID=22663 RepID=A0A6P8DXP0_PUNGR|nr:snRNA-activating protein complex subunit isoform X2 [Punica granatum]